jgi:hypothetical protein
MNTRKKRVFGALAVGILLYSLTFVAPVQATSSHASGGGTYFVEPGVRSQFQFNLSHVQCKVGHAVLHDGTVMREHKTPLFTASGVLTR